MKVWRPTKADWAELTDEEVVERLALRRIRFRNRMSGKLDEARLPAPDAKHTRVIRYTTPEGRNVRAIEFVTAEGWRVVRLRQIESVR